MGETQIKDYFLRDLMDSGISRRIRRNMAPIQELMSRYKCAVMEIETKFNVLNEQFSIQHNRNPIEGIKSRLKSMDSILEKLKRRGLPFSAEAIEENLSDVAGVRVICSFVQDIYALADCLLRQDDITLVRRKDYIKSPKESGYRSLHLIVEVPIFLMNQKRNMKVEIQLRTIAMDFWASLEHKLQYKKNIPDREARIITQELRECAAISTELDLRMERIKDRILQERLVPPLLPGE